MFLFPGIVKNTEKDRKLKDFTFQMSMKKANHLARFNDYDYQTRNFMVSKTALSIIL